MGLEKISGGGRGNIDRDDTTVVNRATAVGRGGGLTQTDDIPVVSRAAAVACGIKHCCCRYNLTWSRFFRSHRSSSSNLIVKHAYTLSRDVGMVLLYFHTVVSLTFLHVRLFFFRVPYKGVYIYIRIQTFFFSISAVVVLLCVVCVSPAIHPGIDTVVLYVSLNRLVIWLRRVEPFRNIIFTTGRHIGKLRATFLFLSVQRYTGA